MIRAKGIDVSFWQSAIDWNKVQVGGTNFAFIRAGQNLSADTRFAENWQASLGKVFRGAYWFYDWRYASPESQGKKFAEVVNSKGELPMVMDFENPYSGWSQTPFPSRDAALDIMVKFKAYASGSDKMILYMNASTLATLRPFPDWLIENWYLWIAAWPYYNGGQCRTYDHIPASFTPQTYGWPWKFWQFTSKLDGRYYGMGSADLDGNVFAGDAMELYKFVNPGIPPTVSDAEKLSRLWNAHPELH